MSEPAATPPAAPAAPAAAVVPPAAPAPSAGAGAGEGTPPAASPPSPPATPPAVAAPPEVPAAPPGAPSAPPAEPARARLGPEGVPHRVFREARVQLREAREELERLRPTAERVSELERQLENARGPLSQYDALMAVLDTNPELRREVLQVLDAMPAGTAPAPPAGARGSAARAGAPGTATLDPSTSQRLDRVISAIEAAEQRTQTQDARNKWNDTQRKLRDAATTFLEEHELDPKLKLLDGREGTLVDSLVRYANAEGDGWATLSDAPHLFNDWYATTGAIQNHMLDRYRVQKEEVRQVAPAALPGGTPPVRTPNAPPPPIGSKEHYAIVREYLRSKGFSNGEEEANP